MQYEALAGAYDRLTQDIPYEEILAFYQKIFRAYRIWPESVLDLACGTGSLSVLLAQQGYRVLGADRSEQMLTQAYEKAMCCVDNPPYFIRQSMQALRLPQQVDCAVCCLDAINYLTKPRDCAQAIARVAKNLRQGGIFIFDINTAGKLKELDGQVFFDEDEDVCCLWRAAFDEKTNVCSYAMELFCRQGALWSRSTELHREYAYSTQELTQYLQQAGFTKIRQYGDRRLRAPKQDEQRIFFAAVKE